MHEHLADFTAQPRGWCSSAGRRRRPPLFRTEKRRDANGQFLPVDREDHRAGQPLLLLLRRRDFGPFFLKFCSYFPYNAKLCINGNEWAKRQAAKAGIGFTALDNGFAAVDDPAAVQAICDGSGPTRSTRCYASGWPYCRTRSPPPIGPPATATTCRSCRPSSR